MTAFFPAGSRSACLVECLLAWLPAVAAEQPVRGELEAVMVEQAPKLDGTLDDPLWQKCPPLVLGGCGGDGPLEPRTEARLLFGPTTVFIAVACDEPNTDDLVARVRERDGEVWGDDCVEIHVSGDHRLGDHQFIVNPAGTLYDARDKDPAWNSGAVVAAGVVPGKRWVATLAIPMADVGAYVGENLPWVLNVNRSRPDGRLWSWAVLGECDFNRRSDFGLVTGVSVPRRADGVTREAEAVPPPPRPLRGTTEGSVVVYERFGDVEVTAARGEFPVAVRDSRDLRIAFLATGGAGARDAAINVFDTLARDNTTSWAPRMLAGEQPLPVVYRCDSFRYNGSSQAVAAKTLYSGIAFIGPAAGRLELRDFVVYRGTDVDPPPQPVGLEGSAGPAGVNLAWKRVADNTGIACHTVARAGADGVFQAIAAAALPAFRDQTAGPGRWSYRVAAVDFHDNVGPWSEAVAVEVPPGGPVEAAATREEQDRVAYAARVRAIHSAGKDKVKKGRVLCFGDSLTHATSYGRAVEGRLGRYEVIARGYPSQRTSFGRDKIAAHLEEFNPEYCLVLLGTNNGKGEADVAAASADLAAIVATCAEHGTVAALATIPPRGFSDPESRPEAGYNSGLAAMARERGIPVAYLFEEFLAADRLESVLCPDGVHFHEDGFDAAGRAWRRVMEQIGVAVLVPD